MTYGQKVIWHDSCSPQMAGLLRPIRVREEGLTEKPHEYAATGSAVWPADAGEESRLHSGCCPDTGTRHWREHRHIQRGERGAAAPAAVHGSGAVSQSSVGPAARERS